MTVVVIEIEERHFHYFFSSSKVLKFSREGAREGESVLCVDLPEAVIAAGDDERSVSVEVNLENTRTGVRGARW